MLSGEVRRMSGVMRGASLGFVVWASVCVILGAVMGRLIGRGVIGRGRGEGRGGRPRAGGCDRRKQVAVEASRGVAHAGVCRVSGVEQQGRVREASL